MAAAAEALSSSPVAASPEAAAAVALSSSTTITSPVVASPEVEEAPLSPSTIITSAIAASPPEAEVAFSSSTTIAASPEAATALSLSTTVVAASPEAEEAALSSSTTITSAIAASPPEAEAAFSSSTPIAASPEAATALTSSTTITSAVVASSTSLSSSTTINTSVAASPEAASVALSSSTTINSSVAAFPEAASVALSSSTTITSPIATSPEAETPLSSSTTITPAVAASPATTKPRLRGVVFDMDGTLTVPVIDFQAMHKAVLGDDEYAAMKSKNPTGIDIIRHVESWSPEKQQKAFEIIMDYERQGLDRLQIMPGASELCEFLNSRNIRRGLITRNFKESVDFFHQRFAMEFSPAVSREFSPSKPDPAPMLHICATWQIQPNEVMMIGDSLKDDVGCGKRAGAYACLLDQTGKYDAPEYANMEYKPDYKVSSLAEVYSLLEANFDLSPCNSLL